MSGGEVTLYSLALRDVEKAKAEIAKLREEKGQLEFRVKRLKGKIKRQASSIEILERSRLALRANNASLRQERSGKEYASWNE